MEKESKFAQLDILMKGMDQRFDRIKAPDQAPFVTAGLQLQQGKLCKLFGKQLLLKFDAPVLQVLQVGEGLYVQTTAGLFWTGAALTVTYWEYDDGERIQNEDDEDITL